MLVVGGNSRVQTASDVAVFGALDALFQRPVAPWSEFGAHDFCLVKRQRLV